MTSMQDSLIKRWDEIDKVGGIGFLQLNISHALEWHIGFQQAGKPALAILTNYEAEQVEQTKSMLVTYRRRETDNRWAILFELLKIEQLSVFANFCCDIIESSKGMASEEDALKSIMDRYREWGQLLEKLESASMSENQCKGLIGELLFLEERLLSNGSPLETVNGWVGSDKSAQDFVYSDKWYEIKSIGSQKNTVKISSIGQLGTETEGELVIMRIDEAAPDREGAFTLNDIARRIQKTLGSKASIAFASKLLKYGYIEQDEYSIQKYAYLSRENYRVDKSFPRLARRFVPPQVIAAEYELSIPSLIDWQKR